MELDINNYIRQCENDAKNEFEKIEEIALFNQRKVLDAFRNNGINSTHFYPTTGYGYDDVGRTMLCKVFSEVFRAEDSIVSPLIANGTHALTLALFGLLRPGDSLLSITGKPYDTLDEVITGQGNGSLADYKINSCNVELTERGEYDFAQIKEKMIALCPKVVFLQRSKGYAWRDAMSIEKIEEGIDFVRKIDKNVTILIDNCYGEFVDKKEPIEVGADVIVGSLIKNPGGGIAPTGGYISGKKSCIEQISYRFTAPSLGMEVGSYIGGYLLYFQGLFLAPSTVKNALKGNVLIGYALRPFSFETMPKPGDMPYDIIKSIKFNTAEELIAFCQLIQKISPVESYVVPEPWDMPGYAHQVIMAAGTFVQGASIELSADGTVRPPYVAYLQGGLTYEHCKLTAMEIVKFFSEK